MSTGWTSTVRFLLEKGADLNAQTISGRTPLMYAVQLGHLNLVTMLLGRKDLLLEASDLEGYTALIIAVEMGAPGEQLLLYRFLHFVSYFTFCCGFCWYCVS